MAKVKAMTEARELTWEEQLRLAIGARGETPAAIARAAGVARPVVTRFLSGERGLTLQTAGKIGAALGLRLSGGGGARRRPPVE